MGKFLTAICVFLIYYGQVSDATIIEKKLYLLNKLKHKLGEHLEKHACMPVENNVEVEVEGQFNNSVLM